MVGEACSEDARIARVNTQKTRDRLIVLYPRNAFLISEFAAYAATSIWGTGFRFSDTFARL